MQSLQPTPLLQHEPNVLYILRKYYNLENGQMDQSINLLEEWCKKQKHFKNKNFDRAYLERTIIACKGSVEKAKVQLDKICTFRTLLPDFFIFKNLKDYADSVRGLASINVMPKMTKDYKRVYIVKLKDNSFNSSHYKTFYQLNLMTAEYMKRFDYVNGFILIDDFTGIDITSMISNINLVELHRYIMILIEGYGARVAGAHLVSSSKVIDALVKVLKPMLSEKLRKRVHVHYNMKGLVEEVGAENLPVEYGGSQYTMDELEKTWYDCVTSEDHEEYLKNMKTYCTDEALKDPKDKEQYMELSGSFRTLTVD